MHVAGFDQMSNCLIQRLTISGTLINYLHSPELEPSRETMVYLDLSNNDLLYVPTVIEQLTRLRTLNLQDNHLFFPDLAPLVDLSELQYLLLAGNRVASYTPPYFGNIHPGIWPNLHSLSCSTIGPLDFTQYHADDSRAPCFLPFELRDKVRSLLILDSDVQVGMFGVQDYFPRVEEFMCHNCSLRMLNSSTFDFPDDQQLRKISLRDNLLQAIPTAAIETCENLQILDLSHNKIEELHFNDLSRNQLIRELYLRGNVISIVEPGSFSGLTQLEVLDLSYNLLEVLPENMLSDQQLPLMSRLSLHYNPLRCDCHNKWLMDEIRQATGERRGPFLGEDLEQTTCGEPPMMTGTEVSLVNLPDTCV